MTAPDRVAADRAAQQGSADVATVLGLRSRGAALVVACAWTAFAALGLASGDVRAPAAYVGGFVILGAGWVAGLRSPSDPMRPWHAVAVAASGVAASGLSVWAAEVSDRAAVLSLGGAVALTSLVLAVRGQIAIAWAGGLLGVLATAVAAQARDINFVTAAQIAVPGNIGILAAATFFAMIIRPRVRQISAMRRLRERGLRERGLGERGGADGEPLAVRGDRIRQLQDRVRPLLERIASGEPLTDREVAMCLLVEAGLRDRIRAPGLDVPELAEAAWQARARGVRVLLLDDRKAAPVLDSTVLHDVRQAAVGVLTGARAGAQVTVRLLPERRDRYATIAVAEDGSARRIDFPPEPAEGGRPAR